MIDNIDYVQEHNSLKMLDFLNVIGNKFWWRQNKAQHNIYDYAR